MLPSRFALDYAALYAMRYFVTLPSGREVAATVTSADGGSLTVEVGGRTVEVEPFQSAGALAVRVGDRAIELNVEGRLPELRVSSRGFRVAVRVESERDRLATRAGGARSGDGLVKSPMPGRVLKVLVREGDEVAPGAPLVVVEAMKMENELVARRAGRVTKVFVSPGSTVEGGAKLVEIE